MSFHNYRKTDSCIVKRKSSTNEWLVVFYHKGKRCEDCTSYHLDKQDALDTAKYQRSRIDAAVSY